MVCNPPFERGTGGWCGCNCGCCPPCPCYIQIVYRFLCGSSNIEYPEAGCNCPEIAFKKTDEEFPDFPDFNLQNETFNFNVDDRMLNILQTTSVCSIPCETIDITISFDGCCLEQITAGSDCYYAIGSGTITATAANACEQDFQIKINGTDIGAGYPANDGELLCIQITPPTEQTCCSCCLVDKIETLLPQCPNTALSMIKRNTITGISKTFLNRKELAKRIQSRRRRR